MRLPRPSTARTNSSGPGAAWQARNARVHRNRALTTRRRGMVGHVDASRPPAATSELELGGGAVTRRMMMILNIFLGTRATEVTDSERERERVDETRPE